LRVKKVYEKLIITKAAPSLSPMEVLPVSEGLNRLDPFNLLLELESLPETGEELSFSPDPATALLDAGKLGVLRVRSFREGDRFVPLGMKESVKLKDFFISRKIPREERRHIPLLLSGDEIVWVVGHRIDDRFKATKETRHRMRAQAAALPSA
jgi:tRNA(Ile)-lysidine synthase